MATPTISSFAASCTLDFGGNTSATNVITGTFNFSRVAFSRDHNGKAEFTADFESDGAIAITGFTATESAFIAGWGGQMTATGFAAVFDAWSGEISMDTVVFGTFASQWKSSRLGTALFRGSCSGVIDEDAFPFPAAE